MTSRRQFLRTLVTGLLAAPLVAKAVVATKPRRESRVFWRIERLYEGPFPSGYNHGYHGPLERIDVVPPRGYDLVCSQEFARIIRTKTFASLNGSIYLANPT